MAPPVFCVLGSKTETKHTASFLGSGITEQSPGKEAAILIAILNCPVMSVLVPAAAGNAAALAALGLSTWNCMSFSGALGPVISGIAVNAMAYLGRPGQCQISRYGADDLPTVRDAIPVGAEA
jgi:hypothetical protein